MKCLPFLQSGAIMIGEFMGTLDWTKLDVVRDTVQVMAVLLSSAASEAIYAAHVFFGNVFSGISFNLSAFPISRLSFMKFTVASTVFLSMAFPYMALAAIRNNPNQVVQGNEYRSWSQMSRRGRWFIQAWMWLSATAYLPVATVVLKIFRCHPDVGVELARYQMASCINLQRDNAGDFTSSTIVCSCADWADYPGLMVGCIIVCIGFLIIYPSLW
jgi:hypothetical protein